MQQNTTVAVIVTATTTTTKTSNNNQDPAPFISTANNNNARPGTTGTNLNFARLVRAEQERVWEQRIRHWYERLATEPAYQALRHQTFSSTEEVRLSSRTLTATTALSQLRPPTAAAGHQPHSSPAAAAAAITNLSLERAFVDWGGLPEHIMVKTSDSIYPKIPTMLETPLNIMLVHSRLTYREQFVIVYRLGYGYTWREIAQPLRLGERTVRNIYRAVLDKLLAALVDDEGEGEGGAADVGSVVVAA